MSLSIPPSGPVGLAVVARHQEATDWSGCPWPVRVVQKDVDLPNAGREASSYAWFCATQRLDPDRTYAFLQGDPFPHGFDWAQLRVVDAFTPMGRVRLEEDRTGEPNHPGLELVRAWQELGIPGDPPERFRFLAGAQFLVPGRVLLSRPPAWWRALADRVSDGGWLSPWVMERLWSHLLLGLRPPLEAS